MADEQATVDVPSSMSIDESAGLFDTLEGEPKAGRPRGPDGKFLPTKKEDEEELNSEEGEPEEPSEPEEEEEQTKEEKAAEKRMLKLKIDGLEQEVDEEEVKSGYLRQSDYTKKTQALAEERKRFEAEDRSVVRQERETYAENLARVQEALEVLAPAREPDWMELQGQMTPEEFTKHFTAWKANRSRLERVEAEQARVRDLQEQDHERVRATRLTREKDLLEEAIPELKDPEKGKALRQDLMDYAKSVGKFTDDDLASVEDHRPLVLLHKARLWDEYQKNLPKVNEKVDRALGSLKPTGSKPAPKSKQLDRLNQQLTSRGSLDDAAAFLDSLSGR